MIYEIIQVFNEAMFDDENAIDTNASPLNTRTHIRNSGEWKVRFQLLIVMRPKRI